MKKTILFFLILSIIICSCSKIEGVYIDPKMKYYFYTTESHVFLFKINKELVKNYIPEKLETGDKKKLNGMLKINRYKKLYLPGGRPYYEAVIFIEVEHKEQKGWFPLKSFVSIPPLDIIPMTKFGYKSLFTMFNYSPVGTNFRASIKRNFNLILEIEFSFLPVETVKNYKKKKTAITNPVFIIKNKEIVKITKVKEKLSQMNISIKEGIGAFLFHKIPGLNMELFNKSKIKEVYFVETKGKYFKRAFRYFQN